MNTPFARWTDTRCYRCDLLMRTSGLKTGFEVDRYAVEAKQGISDHFRVNILKVSPRKQRGRDR